MTHFKTVLFVWFVLIGIGSFGQTNYGQIPSRVKTKADSIILSIIRPGHFSNLTFDCDNSNLHISNPPHLVLNSCDTTLHYLENLSRRKLLTIDFYTLFYKLTIIENATYNFNIGIDTSLNMVDRPDLPDSGNQNAFDIQIDSTKAIELAYASGMKHGLGIFKAKLNFDRGLGQFEWEIQNHLTTNPDRGETFFINAITGQRNVQKDSEWLRSVQH